MSGKFQAKQALTCLICGMTHQLAGKTELLRAAMASGGDLVKYFIDDEDEDKGTSLNWRYVAMTDLRDTIPTILLVTLMTMPWAYSLIAARTFYPAEGITAMDIAFNCQLQYYYPPTQFKSTLVATCPGMEMMRLWPLAELNIMT